MLVAALTLAQWTCCRRWLEKDGILDVAQMNSLVAAFKRVLEFAIGSTLEVVLQCGHSLMLRLTVPIVDKAVETANVACMRSLLQATWDMVEKAGRSKTSTAMFCVIVAGASSLTFDPLICDRMLQKPAMHEFYLDQLAALVDIADDHPGVADSALAHVTHALLSVSLDHRVAFVTTGVTTLAMACLLSWETAAIDAAVTSTEAHLGRIFVLERLQQVLRTFPASEAAHLADLFLALFFKANAKLDAAQPQIFPHSPANAAKLRVWQSILLLVPFLSHTAAQRFAVKLVDALQIDNSAGNRTLMEAALAHIVSLDSSVVAYIADLLQNATARPALVCSLLMAHQHVLMSAKDHNAALFCLVGDAFVQSLLTWLPTSQRVVRYLVLCLISRWLIHDEQSEFCLHWYESFF
jgi:hypothetical protein